MQRGLLRGFAVDGFDVSGIRERGVSIRCLLKAFSRTLYLSHSLLRDALL